jgi:predicted amidophosphoribosyltransferase
MPSGAQSATVSGMPPCFASFAYKPIVKNILEISEVTSHLPLRRWLLRELHEAFQSQSGYDHFILRIVHKPHERLWRW